MQTYYRHQFLFVLFLSYASAQTGFLVRETIADELEPKSADARLEKFHPEKAPAPAGLLLRAGDRLAICGDSITEQKMYSRIIETYLTVCMPELNIAVRQYGWGGETAPGFLARMTNDCLRFHPTIASTCYGMNDHGYRAYEPAIGDRYREASTAIVQAFKNAGARVVQGSPGCVGPKVPWAKGSSEELNLNLCELRNMDIVIASQAGVGFADVFWPMLTASFAAQEKYGPDYLVAGKDAVHPDWSGHLIMAYAFLKSFGLDGDLGTINVDVTSGKATGTRGHQVQDLRDGEVKITSTRYPFCAPGPVDKDNSIRSGMTLVPFNHDLNRLMLVVKGGRASKYRVRWGEVTKSYSSAQLAEGINLADEFVTNPFCEPFKKVDEAIAAKQNYETRQIKSLFHGEEGQVDMEMTMALTEKARQPLANAIRTAFVPVIHSIWITPE